MSQLLSTSTNTGVNGVKGAATTGASAGTAVAGAHSIANSQIANSDAISKDVEAMNMQAALNSIRKAGSELVKSAAG